MLRVRDKRDFSRIFSEGRRGGSALSRVVVAESPEPAGRVAFAAPKRVGGAVVRNRSKRVLRACAAEAGLPRAGKDVVLLATAKTATATHDDLVRSLRLSLERALDPQAQRMGPHGRARSTRRHGRSGR